jgi:hypothetical protein
MLGVTTTALGEKEDRDETPFSKIFTSVESYTK